MRRFGGIIVTEASRNDEVNEMMGMNMKINELLP
jgi:hypothetical protein